MSKRWREALCVLLVAGSTASAAEIQWRSGTWSSDPQDPSEAIGLLQAVAERSADKHLVVQFDGPVGPQAREAVTGAGIQLLNYLGDNAFFASVDATRVDADRVSRIGAIRGIHAIQREWKLHPDLLAGEVHDWSIVSSGAESEKASDELVVAVYVLFHADVDLAAGTAIVQAHGGRVHSQMRSINGLVVELPYDQIDPLAGRDAVQWIEPPLPQMSGVNDDNRVRTGADTAQAAPYGLDGSGVTVFVYDAGEVDDTHADFGGRVIVGDTSGVNYHSTHVAGTVGGSGASSGGTYRGMAPAVDMISFGFEQEGGLQEGFLYTDPGDLETDYNAAINTYGAHISNNSIGTNTAPNGFPCDWEGNYGATGALIDAIVGGSLGSPFRIVWANGNERGNGRCGTTYHTTAPPACAKNHITVGALNSNDDSVTDFTSWGETDDGRLKPDISAPGCQSNGDGGVTSADSGGGYTTLCGTSMAAPTVCGLSALLLQDYRANYPGEPDFRNSTLKAVWAHTAEDIQNPGPDYQTGYGSVRVIPAIELMRAGNFLEDEVNASETVSFLVVADPEDTEVRVTLTWDDVPGTPNVNPVLVNDLDLRVFGPDATQYFPWTLNPANPSAPAVRTQADHVNNIEQVVIDNPAPGAYRIEVLGFNVPSGPQSFSLTATPLLVACSPQGVVSLDRLAYPCEGTATIQVVDCDLNTDDGLVETISVTIDSTTEPGGESVILTETAPETATFRGSLTLSATDGSGVLQVADGDQVTAHYIDADDGQGGINVEVTAAAPVDCAAPVISNVQVIDIDARNATVTFDTDEDARGQVRYGTTCGALNEAASSSAYQTSHALNLKNLDDNTTYYFAVDAEDPASNATTDDNGGVCYTFTTPEVPDFFTEEFTGDQDLDYLTLTFEPNASVDFYDGCVEAEAITELPTDPAGGTTLSLSDDDSELISVTGGESVYLYGVAYTSFYVGSNGYLTFGASDTDYSESLAEHFDTPRISLLYDDLNPSSGGTVSYKQLADRVAVTWENIPQYNESDSNTFQVELFFDGRITVSYLAVAALDGIAGLSEGEGLNPDYYETDLSGLGSCGPKPPVAFGDNYVTDRNTAVDVDLVATDDGLPVPPAALTYWITSLPANGTLTDPGAGAILSVPYQVASGGTEVTYTPNYSYFGADQFRFLANDGGVAPDGGDSNEAVIGLNVVVYPERVYAFPFDSDPGWTTEGQWEFGAPAGGGSHFGDPLAAHTGDYLYGYKIGGDYTDNMPEYFLTSTAIDCSDFVDVELRFWRWLGVEASNFDKATLEVSANGVDWTMVWEHSGPSVNDLAWDQFSYDISAVADGEETVYLRWGMGPTDGGVTYPGLSLDDVEIWAQVAFLPPAIVGARSCADHVSTGELCIVLPDGGVEPRQAGVQKLEFDVSEPVSSVSADVDCAGGPYSGAVTVATAGSIVTVELSEALADENCCVVTLSGDVEGTWQVQSLVGDADRNGVVTAADASAVKPAFGQSATSSNAALDVDCSGLISTTDFSLIKPRFGQAAPACP